jgi:hypothetical protein
LRVGPATSFIDTAVAIANSGKTGRPGAAKVWCQEEPPRGGRRLRSATVRATVAVGALLESSTKLSEALLARRLAADSTCQYGKARQQRQNSFAGDSYLAAQALKRCSSCSP